MTTHTSTVKSKWWYTLPIFLGLFGGAVSWLVLKSFDKKLAKNCLVLGIILSIIEIVLLSGIIISSDILNLATQMGSISDTGDFGIRFTIDTP